jgi:hypothetical protein
MRKPSGEASQRPRGVQHRHDLGGRWRRSFHKAPIPASCRVPSTHTTPWSCIHGLHGYVQVRIHNGGAARATRTAHGRRDELPADHWVNLLPMGVTMIYFAYQVTTATIALVLLLSYFGLRCYRTLGFVVIVLWASARVVYHPVRRPAHDHRALQQLVCGDQARIIGSTILRGCLYYWCCGGGLARSRRRLPDGGNRTDAIYRSHNNLVCTD